MYLFCAIKLPQHGCLRRAVLQASDGSSVAFSKYLNKSPVVVFFYPRAGETDTTHAHRAWRRASPALWPAVLTLLELHVMLRHTRLHETGLQLQRQLRRVPGEPALSTTSPAILTLTR
jgi:hypothetical protein